MKSKLTFIAILSFISLKSFSQTKNAIDFQYGISTTIVLKPMNSMGSGGYDNRHGKTYGLTYTHALTSHWSLTTGLTYSDDYYHFDPDYPSDNPNDSKVNMVSIPVIANLTFLKYLFVDGGVTIDIQTSKKQQLPSQSGLGFEVGAGAKYKFGSVELFVNPYFQRHGVTKFSHPVNLHNAGFKFGAGYCF